MSKFEQRDNSGSLFVNDRKENANHPDRQGTLMVDGKEYWINGWLKKTQDGTPWLSLAVKPKEPKGGQKPNPRASGAVARGGGGGGDDDIPFADPLRGKQSLVQ